MGTPGHESPGQGKLDPYRADDSQPDTGLDDPTALYGGGAGCGPDALASRKATLQNRWLQSDTGNLADDAFGLLNYAIDNCYDRQRGNNVLSAACAALVVQHGDYVVDRLYLRRCTP